MKQSFKNGIKLLLVCFILVASTYNLLFKIERLITKDILRDFSKCVPAKNIAYLKVHKAASSTIQNMLLRYGVKHNLHFALPSSGNLFGHGIPFHSSMIPKNLIGDFDVNIFAIHTQWNYDEVKRVMPKDTIFIASVREPISLFESMYHFGRMGEKIGLPLEKYVKETPPNAKRFLDILGFNQMSFDFGLKIEELQNITSVMALIEKADKQFDLVLLVEKFEESLILLRHFLCWSIYDVVALKINSRIDKFKSHLNNETTALLRDRLSADYLLYNHFKKKLEMKISEFGEENMAREKAELEKAVQRVSKYCNLTFASGKNLTKEFKPVTNKINAIVGDKEKENCRHFMYSEVYFLEEIRRNQKKEVFEKFGFISSLDDNVPEGAVRLGNVQPDNLNNFLGKLKKDFPHLKQ